MNVANIVGFSTRATGVAQHICLEALCVQVVVYNGGILEKPRDVDEVPIPRLLTRFRPPAASADVMHVPGCLGVFRPDERQLLKGREFY